MNTSRIVLGLFVLGTTAYLGARTSRAAEPAGHGAAPASLQEGEEPARYPAEIQIAAVFKPGSAETAIRIPELEIGCGPGPWAGPGGPISFGPEFMKPVSVVFPAHPTDAECKELAQDLLAEGWSLGAPIDPVARCCFKGGVWVPCHPGWPTRVFPVLRGKETATAPYSRTMTIARNGTEETVSIEYLVVVSPVETKPVDAGGPGR